MKKLYPTAKHAIIKGEGPIPCDMMIVLESPGGFEDEEKKPLCGAGKRFLNAELKRLEINPESIYITNAVKCRPPESRTPTNEEAWKHKALLLKEIKTVSPIIVLAMGAVAFRSITDLPMPKIPVVNGSLRGMVQGHWVEVHPTHRMGSIIRREHLKKQFRKDLEYIHSFTISNK